MTQVFFVATPIGNLGDITYRAVQTLQEVDVILCEDTRHSRVLLNNYNISKPTFAYHKFNERSSVDKVLSFIREGKTVAIISDAGTPCISDPGNILVNALIEQGIQYTLIGGVTAFVNAFVCSGYSSPFTFVGFLPEQLVDKDKLIQQVSSNNVLIFYSSVHDINDDLKYLSGALGNREVVVAREISKMYEQLYRSTLGQLTINELKGEFVIVVNRVNKTDNALNDLTIDEHIAFYTQRGTSKMDALKLVAKDRGVSKNQIYKHTITK